MVGGRVMGDGGKGGGEGKTQDLRLGIAYITHSEIDYQKVIISVRP